jgi:hypothetical protein
MGNLIYGRVFVARKSATNVQQAEVEPKLLGQFEDVCTGSDGVVVDFVIPATGAHMEACAQYFEFKFRRQFQKLFRFRIWVTTEFLPEHTNSRTVVEPDSQDQAERKTIL